MSKRDYYEVLGVARDADEAQIKRAYRAKAKQYHPDHNPNDRSAAEKFKEVQEAYDVLKDAKRRSMYDQFGHVAGGTGAHTGEWRTAPGGQRVYTWSGDSGGGLGVDFEDLLRNFGKGSGFEEIFGGRGGHHRASAQVAQPVDLDVRSETTVSFEEAVRGGERELSVTEGAGNRRTIAVKIPAGVKDGQVIRLRGQGSTGGDRSRGDLLITIHVAPHRYFRREGLDIYLDVPVTIAEATLGTKVDVPTLEARTTVAIPPGTPGGTKLRLKHKGVLDPKTQTKGHQYLVIHIVPPQNIDDHQRQQLQEWQDSCHQPDPRASLNWD